MPATTVVKTAEQPPSLIERQPPSESGDSHDDRISINISIHQRQQIFAEGDIITGDATIESLVDIHNPLVEVDLIGYAFTQWENPILGAGVFEGNHAFLTMSCPVEEKRMLVAGSPFSTAWEFTMPPNLLSTSCSHNAEDVVRTAHMVLPPSMDHSVGRFNPSNVKIVYAVRVRLNGLYEAGESENPALLAQTEEPIRFVSGFGGRSNFYPPHDTNSYESRVEQMLEIRKGLSTAPYGKIAIETTGMPSMTLEMGPGHGLPQNERPNRATSVGLRLVFSPESASSKPPEPSSISAKLGIVTSFSPVPKNKLPSLKRNINSQGFISETIRLPQRDMQTVSWTAKEVAGKVEHEAFMVYPVDLQNLDDFVPTFNSCLISRHYKLSVKVVLRHAGAEHVFRLETPMLVAHDPSPFEHSFA